MYKIPQLKAVGSILARSKTANFQLVGHRLQSINTSTNDVKPKSQFVFYLTSTVFTGVVGIAATVVYSKYDPNFRKLITNNIPGSDKFIKICLFEDKEIVDQSKKLGGRIVCKVAQQVKTIKESVGVQSDNFVNKTIDQIKSVTKSLPVSVPLVLNKKEKEAEPQQIISKNQNESVKNYTEKTKSKENVDNPTPEPAIVVTPPRQYTLDELETEILQKSSMAIAALKIATEAIKEYSKNMFNLIESATKKIDPNFNISLQKLEDRKNEIYTKAFEDFKKYGKEIAEKQKLLNNSKFEESPDRLAKSIHKTNEALEELTHANLSLENEYYNLDYIKKYATNVNEAQTSLIKEFESLFPDSDLTQHKINIKNNDFDIFLLYSLKKLNYYQDKLSKQEGILDRKINNAMNTEFLNIETINEINSRLNSEIYKLEEQFNKQLNEFDVKVGEDLQVQLKANAQAHADLVAKAVDFTKEEFENQVHEELSALEKLEHQKYQAQLDLLKSELQSVVNNLKEQATNEKKIFTNQAIWEAGEFLKSSLASSDNEEPIDIKNQINAINKLGASDSVVKQVVSAVPSKALENGVYSKGQLKEDFNQVEKRVYQTALIPDDSFSLPLMVFSYFTSLFVIHHSHISPSEVNNEEFDPLELNTYEIIERARYCIDRDDILQALKYLNLLSGCSRVVAKEWMKKATVFLETKQAIDLLISYTTVISYSAAHTI